MARSIAEIYRDYRIPPNLQRHMLAVAAVAAFIMRDWTGPPLRSNRVLRVLLVHDLGNIVKCDYDKLPAMLQEEQSRVDYWRGVQREYRDRFGPDAGLATYTLAAEVGLCTDEMALVQLMAFESNEQTYRNDDFEVKLTAYADQRVGPRGVLSLHDRFDEARERYGHAPDAFMRGARASELLDYATRIEEQLFRYCKARPNAVCDESIAAFIEQLRGFPMGSSGS